MGFGPFSSSSDTSKTTLTTTVSDQGQLVQKGAKVAQGGAVQVLDSQLAPKNSGNISAGQKSVINYTQGLDPAGVQSLLQNLTSATNKQISDASAAQSSQLGALIASQPAQSGQLSTLILPTTSSGVTDGLVSWLTSQKGWVIAGIAAAVALLFLSKHKS